MCVRGLPEAERRRPGARSARAKGTSRGALLPVLRPGRPCLWRRASPARRTRRRRRRGERQDCGGDDDGGGGLRGR